MKKLSGDEIGYYGRPITELKRDELLELLTKLSTLLRQCHCENEKCREILRTDKLMPENFTDSSRGIAVHS